MRATDSIISILRKKAAPDLDPEIESQYWDRVGELSDKYPLSTKAQTDAYWAEYDAIAQARLDTVIDMADATPEERADAMEPFNRQLETLDKKYEQLSPFV